MPFPLLLINRFAEKQLHMKTTNYLFLLLIILLISCSDDEEPAVKAGDETSLTERLEEIQLNSRFPGFTVGIVTGGKAAYQESFGFQDIQSQMAYTNQTIQPLGSISKTFIGIATVKAIELGLFTMETPINDILQMDLINPKNTTGVIRVKHLVNHTSGLVNPDETYIPSYYILPGENTGTVGADYLNDLGVSQRDHKSLAEFISNYYYQGGDYYSLDNFLESAPGELENYTNTGSSLMALLIEISSEMDYENFLREHIFDPLNMENTGFRYDDTNDDFAMLYLDGGIPLPRYNLESFPDGALKSSNDDMMNYLLDMIAGLRGESTKLFSRSSYELLFTETSPTYSVFWDVHGDGVFGHSGGDPGLGTVLSFSGPANTGAFILVNFDTTTPQSEDYYDTVLQEINTALQQFAAI